MSNKHLLLEMCRRYFKLYLNIIMNNLILRFGDKCV